jgi:hypothetical protein
MRCQRSHDTQWTARVLSRQKQDRNLGNRPQTGVNQASLGRITQSPRPAKQQTSRQPRQAGFGIRECSRRGPAGARKGRTKQKHARIGENSVAAGRADAGAASMQVGTCCASYGRRSLVPALLRWGQLALRIAAPQTVLFQDEHGHPWPHLAQNRRPSSC